MKIPTGFAGAGEKKRKVTETRMVSRFGAQASARVEVSLTEVSRTFAGWVVIRSLTLDMWG